MDLSHSSTKRRSTTATSIVTGRLGTSSANSSSDTYVTVTLGGHSDLVANDDDDDDDDDDENVSIMCQVIFHHSDLQLYHQ